MRIIHVSCVAVAAGLMLAVAPVVTGSAVHAQTTRGVDLTCVDGLNRIERQMFDGYGSLERMIGLARVLSGDESRRLQSSIDRHREILYRLQTRTRELRSRALNPDAAFCDAVRMLERDVTEAVRAVRSFESTVRRTVATARHVEEAIRTTDATLDRAAAVARRSGESEGAFAGLRRAWQLQEDAKQSLAARQFEAALRQTLRAREIVRQTVRAIADSSDIDTYRERAREYYTRTQDMADQLRLRTGTEQRERMERALTIAETHQQRARDLAQSERPYLAMREAQAARRIVVQAARIGTAVRDIDSRLDRAEDSYERARDVVEESDNRAAREMLERSERNLERARELIERDQAGRAIAEIDASVKLAARSVDMVRPDAGSIQRSIDSEIRRTEALIRRAGTVANSDRQRAQLAAASELVATAREQSGHPSRALAALDKATDIAFAVIAQSRKHSRSPEGDIE